MRDQHKIKLFVQHLVFDKEHLIFGMMNACELHHFHGNRYLIKIGQLLVKNLYILHRENCDTVSRVGSPFFLKKIFGLYARSVIQCQAKYFAFILDSF